MMSNDSHTHLRVTGGVHLSSVAFLALLTIVVVPWVLLALHTHPHTSSSETILPSRAAQHGETVPEIREGPWGRLMLFPMLISPIDESLPAGWSRPAAPSWLFPGHDESSLRAFLNELALFKDERADLLDASRWKIEPEGVRLFPGPETILSLDEKSRTRIYAQLARHPANPSQARPWSIKAADFDSTLAASGLSADSQRLIKNVAYAAGQRIFVSDGPTLISAIPDEAEKLRVLRFLKSAETFRVEIQIAPELAIDDVINYWSRQPSKHDFRPLVESMVNSTGGGDLDLVHLLPDFARSRLYTYPAQIDTLTGIRRDCHWSSLNFFADEPDDRFGQTEQVQQYVIEHYYQSSDEPAYGDIIFFTTQAGETLHSATYLAANLTFTKNGDDPYQPWIIMDASDLERLYSSVTQSPVSRQTWKKKKAAGG